MDNNHMAKIVFMGTPDFAVPTLRALIKHHDVVGVVTQPDRPAGRKAGDVPPPIKVVAIEAGIPVLQPEKINKAEDIETLISWDADLHVVAAFGQILPQKVLDVAPHGALNVHASLLPRWRGAAPIHAAIREGDSETGVTIMQIDAGLDSGPMLSCGVVPIAMDETGQSLHDKLAELGATLLINTIDGYLSGAIEPKTQPEEGVTYAAQIQKEDGRIDWNQDAFVIERLVRAFTPWPGTFTTWKGKLLKIHAGEAWAGPGEPGRVCLHHERVAIGTSFGFYLPTKVQLAGKKIVDIDSFMRGHGDFIDSIVGE
jgi:methionyl-tRNA formyltransferase